MQIDRLVVGAFEVNCYLLHGANAHVLMVDPGGDAGKIASMLREQKLSVAAYLVTHGHPDHLSALHELEQQFPAPICMHASDRAWAFSLHNQVAPFYAVPKPPSGTVRDVHEGSSWNDAGLQYTILDTPGHTPGGVCFYFSSIRTLFTGDTLFAGSAGRTDLPGGDGNMLNISLKRLGTLTDDVKVYPGHGPCTTIGHEKQTNPFLQH